MLKDFKKDNIFQQIRKPTVLACMWEFQVLTIVQLEIS